MHSLANLERMAFVIRRLGRFILTDLYDNRTCFLANGNVYFSLSGYVMYSTGQTL